MILGDHKEVFMSTYSKSSTALKEKIQDERPELEVVEPGTTKIIPWPVTEETAPQAKSLKKKAARIEGKFLYHRGHKIPILHFQKSGYDKLLYLLLKEIGR
jgi:hypothetical protein